MNRREFLKYSGIAPLIAVNFSPAGKTIGQLAKNSQNKPNILILVFDSFSALHTSFMGYPRQTTPNFDQFAQRATVYHNHYAGGNFTSPGTASLLTGTYPWTNRAFHLHGTVLNSLAERNIFNALDDSYYKIAYTHNLLATHLLYQFRQALDNLKKTRDLCLDYGQLSDRMFTKDYNNAVIGERTALRDRRNPPSTLLFSLLETIRNKMGKREVDAQYGELFPRGIPTLHAKRFILEDVTDWLLDDLINLPQPFIAYIHVAPPHSPYFTRREFVDVFNDNWEPVTKPDYWGPGSNSQFSNLAPNFLNGARRLYDECIAYVDAEFGRMVAGFEKNGLLKNSYVVATSDHGELFERGIIGHITPALYDSITKIPLLISQPGQKERRDIKKVTSCVDILPTVLHINGQKIPDWCEGNILPNIAGHSDGDADRAVFTVEAKTNSKYQPLETATVMMRKDRYKLIHNITEEESIPPYELYDLVNDPDELVDIFASETTIAQEMKFEMHEHLDEKNTAVG